MVGVTNEGKTGLSAHRIYTTRKLLVRHVVLHDVDKRFVGRLLTTGKLIKRHDVPVADQSNTAI